MSMKEWFDSQSTSGQDPRVWEIFCPQSTYRRCSPSELPSPFFSSGLLQKVDSVVLVNSGSLYMIIFNRVDSMDIDQQPFGFVFLSGSAPPSGGFLPHRDWAHPPTSAPP